jgi:hypothetical protein
MRGARLTKHYIAKANLERRSLIKGKDKKLSP